jgi:N-acetyl-anhydromuramyl-L-alanine amidase AmpD
MKVSGGRLFYDDGRPVPFIPSPNFGGRIEPTLIVGHETADRLKPGDSVAWFQQKKSKVSAHLVVERDGSVTQMVPFDRMAYHAGASEWRGRKSCNGFSIGIEIDNPGLLRPLNKSTAVAWWGESFPRGDLFETDASCTTHGAGCWMLHTTAALDTVEEIVRALLEAYPTIKEFVGHYEISPKRKVDPNPSFPMDRFRRLTTPSIKVVAQQTMAMDVQKRLSQLGYWHGAGDGAIGPLTRQAIRTFQEQNGLPITGEPDAPTLRILASDHALPMPTGGRRAMDAADVKEKSSTLDATGMIKVVAAVAGAGTVGSQVAVPSAPAPALVVPQLPAVDPMPGATLGDAMGRIDGAVASFEQSRSLGERAASLLDWVFTPRGFVTVGLVLLFIVIWSRANKIEWRRIIAEKLGWHHYRA